MVDYTVTISILTLAIDTNNKYSPAFSQLYKATFNPPIPGKYREKPIDSFQASPELFEAGLEKICSGLTKKGHNINTLSDESFRQYVLSLLN
ncbi:MAG: hypothetical protein AABW92_02500 [Nanoarchaeota archaeon]|mgnify:CR=1 FL=1